MILRHRFEPADNRRLARLCGPLDAHLRQIEQALGVRIERRDAEVAVHGSRTAVHVARNLLIELHDSSARTLDERAVRLALVEAGATAPAPAAKRATKAAIKAAVAVPDDTPIHLHTRHADLAGRTPNQVAYLRQILARDICFGIGPAGTGKTFLAVACAVDALERGTVQRIVLTRPAVEAGEKLGFL
ncbi:MAG: PhoH family protein, partial [Rhodoferax sp.]|nr:PhoH family protein [Rhodoferax sp.]